MTWRASAWAVAPAAAVASLGATADVGFGEVLDYLAVDADTRSILLYIEGVTNARAFMSGGELQRPRRTASLKTAVKTGGRSAPRPQPPSCSAGSWSVGAGWAN